MSSKIFGDQEAIKRAQSAKPGDKATYINWDAINELPDEYEVVVTEIKFNPAKLDDDFSDVGNGMWMPGTQLMYKIAEACGISGGDNSITEPLVEEIDINPMLCKPIDEPPIMRRMTVGRKVVKYSTRLQEDGTLIKSSACTSEYNTWERCLETWSKEEQYTEGYTKQSKYPPKYDTSFKRRAHFHAELKFAHAKAETKAHMKTIRELAGLMTGYTPTDLKDGRLIFAKVRRSREVLRMETAARLQALSRGGQIETPATKLLYGDVAEPESVAQDEPQSAEPAPEPVEDAAPVETFDPPEDVEPEPEPKSNRETLIEVLGHYQSEGLIVKEYEESADKILGWLKRNKDAESNATWWEKAIKILHSIETKIPDEGKVSHAL
jgi:hypothetical protein